MRGRWWQYNNNSSSGSTAYGTIADAETDESRVDWEQHHQYHLRQQQPSASLGTGEGAHLLAPVAIPGIAMYSGSTSNTGVGTGSGQVHNPTLSHPYANVGSGGSVNSIDEGGSVLADGERFDLRSRQRRATLNGPEEVAAVSSFFKGNQAFRVRFLSEDNNNTRPSSTSSSQPGSSAATRKRPLWQSIRWKGGGPPPLERRASDIIQSNTFGNSYDPVGGGIGLGVGGGGGCPGGSPSIPDLLPLAFDPDYDTSRVHLVKLFNSLDKNRTGTITYEAMRMGLANLGTYSDLNYVMRKVDMDKSKEITLDDFVETVQEYAAKIFADKQASPVSCFCYDYSPEAVAFRWVNTGDSNPPSPSVSLRQLMSEERCNKSGVRWVCLTGSGPSLVIHMANRYGIHPLQVEDCLNPKERLKVDSYRAPVKHNSCPSSPAAENPSKETKSGDQSDGEADEARGPRPLQEKPYAPDEASQGSTKSEPSQTSVSRGSELQAAPAMSVDGVEASVAFPEESDGARGEKISSGSGNTGKAGGTEEILHVLLGRISLRNPTVGRPSNFGREQVSIFLIGDHTVLFIEPSPSAVSDQISNRIYYAGSKLRLNNARYLVYSLMDSIVDDVFPIMQHFQTMLVKLQDELHSVNDGPSLEIVRAIQQISRDMHMITFYLRPMKMVATQLITDLPGSDADLKRHLEDVRDHVLMLEEQALRMSTWSRSLNKDWVNEQQHRMNQVVYILTMVTSAFMPAQFLTGVFGMNFKFMPELNWRYSYASFWVLVALLAFTSFTVYKRHKWL